MKNRIERDPGERRFRFGAYVPEENGVIVYFVRCIVVDRPAVALSLSSPHP